MFGPTSTHLTSDEAAHQNFMKGVQELLAKLECVPNILMASAPTMSQHTTLSDFGIAGGIPVDHHPIIIVANESNNFRQSKLTFRCYKERSVTKKQIEITGEVYEP